MRIISYTPESPTEALIGSILDALEVTLNKTEKIAVKGQALTDAVNLYSERSTEFDVSLDSPGYEGFSLHIREDVLKIYRYRNLIAEVSSDDRIASLHQIVNQACLSAAINQITDLSEITGR